MKSKKFVLAGLVLLAITMVLLPLSGCKNDSVPEPTRYAVSFDKGDNSEYTGDLPADITVESGTKLTAEQLKGLADTADYIFEGWYDGTTKAEGGTYTVTKDVTLEAKWRERGVTAAVSFSVDENGRVALSSETKDAVIYYTINGSGPDENSSKYGEPIEISAQTTVRAYAQGTGMKPSEVAEKTYLVVTFNTNGGSDVAPQVVESETKLTAEQLKGLADTADYIFEGWYDGTTKAEGGTYTVTKDVTLEAKWRERGVTAAVSFSVDENGRVALSSETKDAVIYYTINGSGPDENSSKYGEPIEISAQTTVRAYAQGTGMKPSEVAEKTYLVVTFNTNGGSDVAPQVVESGRTATRPEPDPTKDGWVFAGWYTSADGGKTLTDTAYDFDTPVEGDIILYAAWNGRDSGNIVLKNKVMSKTSEVQVLSTAVYLKDLYNAASNSRIFVENRVGSIQPFVMGQYEVTQQLYSAVMGSNPSKFTSDVAAEETQELRPVENVSWYDAVVFCNELTKKVLDDGDCVYYSDAGLTAVYTTGDGTDGKTPYMDISKSGYRLPTEAEWELAARGGNPKADAWKYTYAGSSTIGGVAWYSGNNSSKTHEVGTKAANDLNLYDMSGNVWEWCWDWWASSITEATPSGGADSGAYRVRRGGGWSNGTGNCTVSYRLDCDFPDSRWTFLGFRLVRSAN